MILFKDDWKYYPEAIADLDTKNRSWVRYSGLLKTMGIQNHLFPLALHNPLLKGVDPYDPELTEDQKDMIIEECSENPWYFFREVVRIPSKGAIEPERFRANRLNISLYWTFFVGITPYVIAIRQIGKSLSSDLLYKGILSFWGFNSSITIITKDNKLRVDEVERLKAIENSLPEYLRMIGKNDLHSIDGITVNALGNRLNIVIAQKSKEAARNLGRGTTSTIFGVDEFAFLYNNDISIPAALAAGSAARDTARRNGQLAGTIFYTTAGYLDTKSGEYAYRFYKSAMRWTERLLDLPNKESVAAVVKKNIPKNAPTDMILIEMNHRQLGYTDDWLRQKIREAAAEGIAVEAEFLNKWSKGSSSALLSKDTIKMLNNSVREPNYSEITNEGFIINWYINKDKINSYSNRMLVMGLDSSDALGGDDIGVYIRDVITGETIATMKVNNSNIIEFAITIYDLLNRYNKMTLIIERRSSAMSIIDQLAILFINDGKNIFKRVYNTIVNDGEIYPDKLDEVLKEGHKKHIYLKYKKAFGFATSGGGTTSRDSLYNHIYQATELTGNKTRDKDLVDQLSKLEKKNGRIDHSTGEHDDLVIAYLLTWWLLKEGKNLHIYGINKSLVLTAVEITNENKKLVENRKKIDFIEQTVNQIDNLLNKLKTEKNFIKIEKIKLQINLLKGRLDTSTIKSLNIEGRLEEILNKDINNSLDISSKNYNRQQAIYTKLARAF